MKRSAFTSKTAAFSEHGKGDFDNYVSSKTDTFWPQTLPKNPDEAVSQCESIDEKNISFQRISEVGAPWIRGYHSTTIYFHASNPNKRSCMFPPGRISTTAQSYHSNGVNICMLDGSTNYMLLFLIDYLYLWDYEDLISSTVTPFLNLLIILSKVSFGKDLLILSLFFCLFNNSSISGVGNSSI